MLLQALRSWGALDKNYAYKANLISADYPRLRQGSGRRARRRADRRRADRPVRHPEVAAVAQLAEFRAAYEFQTTMFQPVGGMDMIGKAFAKEVGDLIRYNAKVTADRAGRERRHGDLCGRAKRRPRRRARRPTGASAPSRCRS